MIYYIDWPRTPSFLSGLVKTKSDFVFRLVKADLETLTLVLAMISVDFYPFLAFSNLNCHPKDTEICVFR